MQVMVVASVRKIFGVQEMIYFGGKMAGGVGFIASIRLLDARNQSPVLFDLKCECPSSQSRYFCF